MRTILKEKTAVVTGASRGIGRETAIKLAQKGIRVNAVAPGYIDTDMLKSLSPELREKFKANLPMKKFGLQKRLQLLLCFWHLTRHLTLLELPC